jgi:hypothetical protein
VSGVCFTGSPATAAASDNDSFIVAYSQHYSSDAWTGEIMANRVDSGANLGIEFKVFHDEELGDQNPAVVQGAGQFLVAWEREHLNSSAWDVVGKLMGGLGPFDLTVSKIGTGSGTVISYPAGIDCGIDCTETHPLGATVRLEAANDLGSVFTGWGGDCVGSQVSVYISMDRDRVCTAKFKRTVFDLNVRPAGPGSGSISSRTGEITCGTDCSGIYNENASETLTATADLGSVFAGWSGDCSGTDPQVLLTMDAQKACTATFDPASFVLNVTVSGSGAVDSSPGGISCGSDCAEEYPAGTIVDLTPTAAAANAFNGWGGDADCADGTVELSANISCSATFIALPDLTVLSVNTVPASPSASVPVAVSISLRNDGGAAEPFWVDFYMDSVSAPAAGAPGDFFCDLPALAGGASTTCSGTVVYPASGAFSMWAAVDAPGAIAEGDETDNVLGPQAITVAAAPPLPGPDALPAPAPFTGCEATGISVDARIDDNGDNTPDNTATSLGTIEQFHTVASGSTLDVDVVTCLPAGKDLWNMLYSLEFDGTALNVTAQTHDDPAVNLIASAANSGVYDESEPAPDCEGGVSDGSCDPAAQHFVSVLDFGTAETGFVKGVAGRYTFEASSPGCFSLQLSNAVLVSLNGEAIDVQPRSAFIGVDIAGPQDCGGDLDRDGAPDETDACPLSAEDIDSFQDGDDCADPDNDGDGICDPGQIAESCSGFDFGQSSFFASGHHAGASHVNLAPQDCRNTPEDADAFRDRDGCPEPDNDNDSVLDASDQCPGNDAAAGPDSVLGPAEDQDHDGVLDAGEDLNGDGVLSTDDRFRTWEDLDGVLDADGCPDVAGQDSDRDGYKDDDEQQIGTRTGKPCGTDGWPSDIVGTGISFNKFNIVDLGSFVAPVRRLGTKPGDTNFNVRWDLKPGPLTPSGAHINIQDLAITVTGATGFPPMFATQKALGHTCPFPP